MKIKLYNWALLCHRGLRLFTFYEYWSALIKLEIYLHYFRVSALPEVILLKLTVILHKYLLV